MHLHFLRFIFPKVVFRVCSLSYQPQSTILGDPSINRIEGKAANLEAENHVLRQQATATPPSTAKSPPSRSKITRIHVMYL